MGALDPIARKSVESGLVLPGAVSENRRPVTSVMESVNFDFDSIGSATLRKGTTLLGNALSGNMLGVFYHVDTVSSTPNSRLITVNATTAYYLTGGSFTAIRTGLTAGSKARFSTFLNFAFMVNGTEATAVWDGNIANSFVTTGNASGAPTGKYIENFRSRMWIAGNTTYPDRLYYSSIPSSVTTPVVTWDTSVTTGQWIDISPSDGENITALKRTRNNMLVFKTNRLYRVYSIVQTDPDPYYAVGTSSQESVLDSKAGVFFHHSSGFYQYNIYGVVQEISRPIIDIIRAIPASSYSSIAGWLEPDGDHICWSIGTVTVNGQTFTNMVVRYTISTQVWTHRLYPSQVLCAVGKPSYTDGTTQFAVVGDNAGSILEMNTGKTDNGTAIQYSLVHRWDNIDGLLSTRKTMNVGVFSHSGGAGANVSYQNEEQGDFSNDWSKSVGQLDEQNTGFNSMDIKARKVRFRLSGASTGEPFTYNGYELIDAQNEFIQFSGQF